MRSSGGEIMKTVKGTQAELATKADLKDLEQRLKIRAGTLMAGAVVVIVALKKLV